MMIRQPVSLSSTYSETHIGGMYQLEGHSWQIFHSAFCNRLDYKCWQL